MDRFPAHVKLYGEVADGRVALVSPEDYERVVAYGRWWVTQSKVNQYVYTWEREEPGGRYKKPQRKLYLHRFLTDAPRTRHVDHRNRDPFDNQRHNLRVCFPADNNLNRGLYDIDPDEDEAGLVEEVSA